MFSISCPIASLLAEVVVGRYKFISYTLRAQSLLCVVGSVIIVGEYYLPTNIGSTSQEIGYYLLGILAVAALIAVAIPLGLDQVAGMSNTNITAFIVWSWRLLDKPLQTSLHHCSATARIFKKMKSA
jgi:hypothetical protein